MSIVTNAKELAELIKKIGDVELYRRIVELEGEIIELTRSKRDAEAEIERLRKTLTLHDDMRYEKPFYFMKDDKVPYCPRCWEVDQIAVHMGGPRKTSVGPCYICLNCKSTVYQRCGASNINRLSVPLSGH